MPAADTNTQPSSTQPSKPQPSYAPWDANTWEELEEELADISPTVRVQWEAASLTYTIPPQPVPWSAPQQNVNESWNTYNGYSTVWKPPAQRRREAAVTPWNVKAPRLSSTVMNQEVEKGNGAVVEVPGAREGLGSCDTPLEAVRVSQDAGFAKRPGGLNYDNDSQEPTQPIVRSWGLEIDVLEIGPKSPDFEALDMTPHVVQHMVCAFVLGDKQRLLIGPTELGRKQ